MEKKMENEMETVIIQRTIGVRCPVGSKKLVLRMQDFRFDNALRSISRFSEPLGEWGTHRGHHQQDASPVSPVVLLFAPAPPTP